MSHSAQNNYQELFVGLDTSVPLLDGTLQKYINLDNSASTPALKHVAETINYFLNYYSSVHRGTGFKSQLSTYAYEQARETVLHFLHADPAHHVCIFGKNTTEAVNKLARRFPFSPARDIVLVSHMEHHSNDLPWRQVARELRVAVTPEGRLDEADFDQKLADYGDRIALVSISGASNVTGFINPIHRLAEKTHCIGAQIAVDCAQLAPHRKIDMRPLNDPGHLDYVMLSAHKMYAPFGAGALVGRRETFEQGSPDLQGGGEVEIVTSDTVFWSDPPDREEAGSPNILGAIALAAAIDKLEQVGMDAVAAHEAELTQHALRGLASIPGIEIYGDADASRAAERVGVIPLNLAGKSHYQVAAILGYEFGIGVRNGCFCAHPYLLHLLKVPPDEVSLVRENILQNDRRHVPGMVRISFGLYNTTAEVDACLRALECISNGSYRGSYHQDVKSGQYIPAGWQVNLSDYSPLKNGRRGKTE